MKMNDQALIHMFRQVRSVGVKNKNELLQHTDVVHDFEEFDHLLIRIEALLLHIDRINSMATN